MRTHRTLAVTSLGLLLVIASAAGAQGVSEARDLYSSASYEQALTVLERIRQGNVATPEALLSIEQYRAYCLLALNRKSDAQQAIETVYTIDPFFLPAEDEVAPWVRTAFKDGRRRALPAAVQRLYAQGKDALDRKVYPEAITRFKQVLALLNDPDMPADKEAIVDYRPLAQGFLDLATAASAAAPSKPQEPPAPQPPTTAPPATKPPAAPPVAATSAAATPAGGTAGVETSQPSVARIYGPTDTDVIPPVPIRQDIPRWPASYLPAGSPDGVIEVVINESGGVESVAIRQSLNSFYDGQLLQAAKSWRYQPAMKGGSAVKYRRLVKISFSGR